MTDLAPPEISFGRIARTVSYRDSRGSLIFTFDLASPQPDSKGIWTLILDSGTALGGPPITRIASPSDQDRAWIGLARDRVIEYLRSRPYDVIDSEDANKT